MNNSMNYQLHEISGNFIKFVYKVGDWAIWICTIVGTIQVYLSSGHTELHV